MTKRQRRNLLLAGWAGLQILALYVAFGFATEEWVWPREPKADYPIWRVNMALAYTALTFLTVALVGGPLNVLRDQHNPTNSMVRRDIGIWAGVLALTHAVVGAQVHSESLRLWWLFFTEVPSLQNPLPLRMDRFMLANLLGAFQAALFGLLLLISNNRALRRLGTRRWKWLQRLTYVAAASVAAHGLLYQLIERRDAKISAVFLTFFAIHLSA